ncbi:MAG TPA: carbamate kinase [Candidatus Bathyarchaeia archaeon]|nr:carbamate kinase [Candidatus Bathyarchaeia archaeon]
MTRADRILIIAVGGNALIREGQRGTIAEQFENARATAVPVGALAAEGWRIVLTHGNGPQVGFILRRSEIVAEAEFTPRLTLDMCVADSEGGIGYILANSLVSEMGRRGLRDRVACVLTQTVVDAGDPAFTHPSKPIGAGYSAEEAERHRVHDRWVLVEDAGRGYRRLVPSPRPVRIVETDAIAALLEAGFLVIAGGGGGIPVVEEQPGVYRGVEAVVDKDFASGYLAAHLGASVFVLSTGVEKVAIGFRTPRQRFIDRVTLAEARRYLDAGEFPEGSMGPKVRAAIEFVERGGGRAIITSPAHIADAMAGRTGTHLVAA